MDNILGKLEELSINTPLPDEFSKIGVDDERTRLFKTYYLANKLLNSDDTNTKILFKNSIKNIYIHYLDKTSFDDETYKEDIKNKSKQEQHSFLIMVRNLHTLLIEYINFSGDWQPDFAIIKIIEISKLIIEIINPISEIQLDLSKLNI